MYGLYRNHINLLRIWIIILFMKTESPWLRLGWTCVAMNFFNIMDRIIVHSPSIRTTHYFIFTNFFNDETS